MCVYVCVCSLFINLVLLLRCEVVTLTQTLENPPMYRYAKYASVVCVCMSRLLTQRACVGYFFAAAVTAVVGVIRICVAQRKYMYVVRHICVCFSV